MLKRQNTKIYLTKTLNLVAQLDREIMYSQLVHPKRLDRLLFDALSKEDYSTAASLLEEGADPNALLPEGAAAFHVAVGLDSAPEYLTRLLLQYGANPNIQSTDGVTPLHVAASYGKCEVVRLLLLNGANPHIIDQDGQTPAECAQLSGCHLCILQMKDLCDQKSDEYVDRAFPIEPTDLEESLPYDPTNSPGENHQGDETWGFEELAMANESDTSQEYSSTSSSGDICAKMDGMDTCQPGQAWGSKGSRSMYTAKTLFDNLEPSRHITDVTSPDHQLFYTRGNGSVRVTSQEKIADREAVCAAADSSASSSFHTCSSGDNSSDQQLEGIPNTSDRLALVTKTHDLVYCETKKRPKGTENVSHGTCVSSIVKQRSPTKVLSPPQGTHKEPSQNEIASSDQPDEVNRTDGETLAADDSVATCNSSGFVPSEFDPNDLSLNICLESQPQNAPQTETVMSGNSKTAQGSWISKVRDAWFTFSQGPPAAQESEETSPENVVNNTRCNPCLEGTNQKLGQNLFNDLFTSDESESEENIMRRHSNKKHDRVSSKELETGQKGLPKSPDGFNVSDVSADEFSPEYSKTPKTSSMRATLNQSELDSMLDLTVSTIQSNVSEAGASSSKGTELQTGKWYPQTKKAVFGSCSSSRHLKSQCRKEKGKIETLYTDDEDGYSVVETWFPVTESRNVPNHTNQKQENGAPLCHSDHHSKDTTLLYDCKKTADSAEITVTYDWRAGGDQATNQVKHSSSKDDGPRGKDDQESVDERENVSYLTDAQLRAELVALGNSPGPVTLATRRIYQLKLVRLRKDPTLANPVPALWNRAGYTPEMMQALSGELDTSTLQDLEDIMARPFADPDPSRHWREGTQKSSFNYLLLDPRITQNLPSRRKEIGELEGLHIFIKSIFYVGKGKRSRPYAHFKEAIQHNQNKQASSKVQRILQIWEDGQGVVSLHIFQNVIPVEAYTREACMIEAIGRPKLTNVKAGEYYGLAVTWPMKKKRCLGVRLLHKAFRIFLSEGERHIRPSDVRAH